MKNFLVIHYHEHGESYYNILCDYEVTGRYTDINDGKVNVVICRLNINVFFEEDDTIEIVEINKPVKIEL